MVSRDSKQRRAKQYHHCIRYWERTGMIRWSDWYRIRHYRVVGSSCVRFDSMDCIPSLVECGWSVAPFRETMTRTIRTSSLVPSQCGPRSPWNRTSDRRSRCMGHRWSGSNGRSDCSFPGSRGWSDPCSIHGRCCVRLTNRPSCRPKLVHGCSRRGSCRGIGIPLDLKWDKQNDFG